MQLQLYVLWMAVQAVAFTFPTTVEVDLLFPRNETYAPSERFPIVFGIQNAALAPSLDPNLLLTIRDMNAPGNSTYDPSLSLKNTNFSGSDPFYVYTTVSNLTASTYVLVWDFEAANCSNLNQPSSRPGGGIHEDHVVFTIQGGAPEPDIAPTSTSCANLPHFAFNLTDTQSVGLPALYDGRNSCAIFSEVQPFVTGDPCALQVSAAASSSISAALAGHTGGGKPGVASGGLASRGSVANAGLTLVGASVGAILVL